MATRARGLYRGGAGVTGRYHIGATTVAGQIMMRDSSTNLASEAIPAVQGTGNVNLLGVAAEAVVYSTTQGDFDNFPSYKAPGEEGTVRLIVDPLQVLALRCSGGATVGTALATTAPANVLTNTSASAGGTVVTAAEVGTITFVAGLIMGRTGNNAGVAKVISSHSDNTSTTVTEPFANAIAVGDTFIRVPFSKKIIAVDLTTNFVEADAIIEVGTAAGEFNVLDVEFDIINDEVIVYVVPRSHLFNALA